MVLEVWNPSIFLLVVQAFGKTRVRVRYAGGLEGALRRVEAVELRVKKAKGRRGKEKRK